MEPKRARTEAAPWLLPPIVLQVTHCLTETTDVLAFLHAVPYDARDESLDALVTILTQNASLWPRSYASSLADLDVVTVTRALPALRTLIFDVFANSADFCPHTQLPPTTDVCASINDPRELGSRLSNRVTCITHLDIWIDEAPRNTLPRELAACTKLESLRVDWNNEPATQEQVDSIMATIAASCPRLASLHLSAMDEVVLQSCDGLLDWLARPSARLLKLNSIEFAPRAAKTLARVLLSSTTLRTIMLFYTPYTRDAFFEPTAPPLPRQLRKLAIELDANWYIAPAVFDKLASSAVTRLQLRSDMHCDVAPVVAALAPALKALKLDEVKMKRLPPLPVLQYLQLSDATLASEAVVDLASLLVTSTSLFRLDLRHSELPDDQLQTILYALPRWLSRQQRTCYVYLSVSPETETLVTAALLRTRNTFEVQLEINGSELAVCQRLLTVLGATSRMKMRFICLGDRICNRERLEMHARLQRVETESSWFLSPSTTPWVSLA